MKNIFSFKRKISKLTAFILLASLLICGGARMSFAALSSDENEKEYSEDAAPAHTEYADKVYLGGIPFGVKFYTEGITVVGFSDVDTESEDKSPAYSAGLRENDVIISVNDTAVSSVSDFILAAENSKGSPIKVVYKRMGKTNTVSFSPVLSSEEKKYKTGMWIKDSTAGIGTLTYIIPSTNGFGGLGHSICDSSGEILKLTKGIVMDVEISGIEKSVPGTPGELKGSFSSYRTGTLSCNTQAGVFGLFSKIPDAISDKNLIEIADTSEAKQGPAIVRCTLEPGKTDEYEVEIAGIDTEEKSGKNFIIEVTDPRLIEKTGGIVQGMSGSPIVQNGKLIGAVTHVFISDPKKGYGISISNMLNSMPDMLK